MIQPLCPFALSVSKSEPRSYFDRLSTNGKGSAKRFVGGWLVFALLLGAVPIALAQDISGEAEDDLLGGFEDSESAGEESEDLLGGFDESDSGDGDDDLLGGFEEEAEPEAKATTAQDSLRPKAFSGSVGFDLSYAYAQDAPATTQHPDWRGLRKSRSFVQLKWDGKYGGVRVFLDTKASYDAAPDPLSASRRNALSTAFRNEYKDARKTVVQEAEFREAFVQFSPLAFLDVTFGRQIIAWGLVDSLTVLDVLNPRDNREPGLVDLEDMRLPVTATRLDCFFSDFQLQLAALHEIRFHKEPRFGSEFHYYAETANFSGAKNQLGFLTEDLPAHGGANTEFGVALKGFFSGWDAALHYADVYEDAAHYADPSSLSSSTPTRRKHALLKLLGAGVNVAAGSWLVKGELAQVRGLRFFGNERNHSRNDAAFGVEYSGITDVTLGAEALYQHLNEFDELPQNSLTASVEREIVQSLLSWRQDFLQQTLHFNLLLFQLGRTGDKGGSRRVGFDYDWSDGLTVGGGLLAYTSGSSAIARQFDPNDRLFAQLSYAF